MRTILTILRGIGGAVCNIFFLFFPSESDHGPTYYRSRSEDHSEYLPGFPGRETMRARYTWRPPLAGKKLPVDD